MKDNNQLIYVHEKTGRMVVETINLEPTLTQQQFKDDCDINNIVAKFSNTGEFKHLTKKTGVYADFSEIRDYQEMLETVKYGQEAFASLPAKTRARFANNPGELLSFIQDPKNKDEAIAIGLIDPPPKVESETTKT